MNKVIEMAAAAERDGSLSGIILIMKGTENRETQSIKLISTILKCSLPDVILTNMIVVFTMCSDPDLCQSQDLIPFDIDAANKFYIDNKAFSVDLPRAEERTRNKCLSSWMETMDEVKSVLERVFSQSTIPSQGAFSQLVSIRMRTKAIFHEIKNDLLKLCQALSKVEKAEQDKAAATQKRNQTQDYIKRQTIKQRVLVNDPHHSTICSACTFVCHHHCGLTEITDAGSNAFQRCAAFSGNSNCQRCPKKCSYQHSTIMQEKLLSKRM